jgi:hypothetical protein
MKPDISLVTKTGHLNLLRTRYGLSATRNPSQKQLALLPEYAALEREHRLRWSRSTNHRFDLIIGHDSAMRTSHTHRGMRERPINVHGLACADQGPRGLLSMRTTAGFGFYRFPVVKSRKGFGHISRSTNCKILRINVKSSPTTNCDLFWAGKAGHVSDDQGRQQAPEIIDALKASKRRFAGVPGGCAGRDRNSPSHTLFPSGSARL